MGSIYILSTIKRKYGKQRSSKMIHVDEDDPVGELEPSFPHRDVTIKRGKDPEECYELLSEIGRGKFGTVYHCKEKATGLELAAKFVGVARREERRNVEREVDIMRQLQHPRLIQLYDAYDSGKTMCVVLELITGGELFERVIDDDFVLTEKACTVFMRQICEGIEFVHQQNILHLDMKPENILCLTKTGNRIKIIDFGLARKFDPTKKLQVLFGTPEFVAPEVVNFDQIGFGTDMWSIGVICYVLLSGLSPFMGETDIETMANVTIAKYDFDDEAFNEISDDAKDFIKQLLIKDKQSRMTAQQCVAHKWLQKRPPRTEDAKKETPQPVKPITKMRASPQEELDLAKENLRLFVERWSEHPNSPYLFDVATHEITPCMSLSNFDGLERSMSQQSIGGCSPSPCGSISSIPECVMEAEASTLPAVEKVEKSEFEDNDAQYNNSYHNLERRASDSSCMVNKKADVSLRVNLAEEIKKLSERLYVLSTMNTDLVNNNVQSEVKPQIIEEKSHCTLKNGHVNTNNHSSITTTNKEVKTTTTSNRSFYSTTSNDQKFTSSTITSERCTQKIDNNNDNIFKSVSEKTQHRNYTNLSDDFENNSFEDNLSSYSNLPWSKRKFKISNFSRDVPLSNERKKSVLEDELSKKVENGSSTHKTEDSKETNGASDNKRYYKKLDSNGDVNSNANNTKDLLLHLLDQWGDSQSPPNNCHAGRHKSVSMEWSESDSIASKSMNSLNTFFKRQSSTSSTVKKKQEAFTSDNFK